MGCCWIYYRDKHRSKSQAKSLAADTHSKDDIATGQNEELPLIYTIYYGSLRHQNNTQFMFRNKQSPLSTFLITLKAGREIGRKHGR